MTTSNTLIACSLLMLQGCAAGPERDSPTLYERLTSSDSVTQSTQPYEDSHYYDGDTSAESTNSGNSTLYDKIKRYFQQR